MNAYQKEQMDALLQARQQLATLGTNARNKLIQAIQPYLKFRIELERFIDTHMGSLCTQACFESQTSACCSKDGIITFWADVVINACTCDSKDLDALAYAIKAPLYGHRCIYLGADGCLWKTRPLVCAMFVCDQVESEILARRAELHDQWNNYQQQAKAFRWPDKPVLFDRLERVFMDKGCRSPLMYMHTSPGLLRIKRKAGLL